MEKINLKKAGHCLESSARSYSFNFDKKFKSALGCYIFDENGNKYLDFLSGAG